MDYLINLIKEFIEGQELVTSELGWYDLKNFVVSSLKVTKLSSGNVVNPFSSVEVTVSGNVPDGYELHKLHVCKRFEMREDEQIVVVNITPFVTLKGDGFTLPFKESINIKIPMWKYGANTALFVSGDKQVEINLFQSK